METLKNRSIFLYFFFLCFAGRIPELVQADEATLPRDHLDDYWQQRAKQATAYVDAAFTPKPEEVTKHFDYHVGRFINETDTRRNLKDNDPNRERSKNKWWNKGGGDGKPKNTNPRKNKYVGGCWATNPIDECWRCDKNWAENRKKLADCALGFGRKATGGKNGRFYVVSDHSDDPLNPQPGTLRHAVIQKEPLWIIFSRNMDIYLKEELLVNCDKTIDGRGANVHISRGAGITIQYVNNVIVHNLHIHDIKECSGGMIRDSVDHFGVRTKSDGDGISIFGSSNVWIDHISMSNCKDGLIDAIMGSTAITISNCHFTHHDEVMLFGASDSHTADEKMQITVAFNHFGQGLQQRMPRCRYGFFHIVNNDYTHWLLYAIGGSKHPTIISQGNRFIASNNASIKEVTQRNNHLQESEWKDWIWRSEGDLMVNGAFFVQSGDPNYAKKFSSDAIITAKPATMIGVLTKFTGFLNCKHGFPC